MLRRKLFAYTVMMAAGISAGFFVLERCEFVRGILIMAAAGVSAALADRPAFANERKDRLILFVIMIAGFMLFTCRFIYYEAAAIPDDTSEVTGTACLVKSVESGYEMILTDTDLKGMNKIQIRLYTHYYGYSSEPDNTDEIPDELTDMIGRRVTAYGRVSELYTADNPGCFDNRLYMRGKGISCRFIADSVISEDDVRNIYWKYRRRLIKDRNSFLKLFRDKETRGFIRGVVFGDKSGIDEETREEFSINSTGHILAVSGLHIGFLYALLRRLAGRKRNRAVSFLIFIVIFLYGEMTLWSASTVRTVMVLSISMLSFYVRRPADLLTSVSAAAFIILIREPYQLFDSGFQMSFTALTAIAFLSEPLKHFVGEYMSSLIAVQTGIVPLSAFLFNRFNPASLLINIPVVWLASILVPVCLILMIASLVFGAGGIPEFAVKMAEGLSEIVVKVNRLLSYDGFFSTRVISVNAGVIAAAYMSLLLVCSEWARIRFLRHETAHLARAFASVIIVSAAIGAAAFNCYVDDEIIFVSVGQGDCTHIRADTHDILIDGGGSTEYNIGKNTLIPYLLSNGASDIDLAIATHLHTDHFKGICELCEDYPVGCTMIPEGYRRTVEDGSITVPENIMFATSGSRIEVTEDVYIEPIWPQPGRTTDYSFDDQNENNMVYMIHYKDVRVMITGDLLEEDELEMVKYYKGTDKLKCDVLKVAHHGSKSSSSEEFLDAASPSVAVIQVGRNNIYGHPHRQTLDRLKERGIPVYRTDVNGAVGIDIRGTVLKTDVMRSQTIRNEVIPEL